MHNTTALVLPLSAASPHGTTEPVTQTAWCGQCSDRRLAAAAGCTIGVFAMEQYIASLDEGAAAELTADHIPSCHVVHSHSVMALSWTQEGDGLLSADSQGCVIMWRFTNHAYTSKQMTQAWIGGNSTVIQPQSILTAGANILSPSASACPGTKAVTIWWPEELQRDAPETQSSEPPVMLAIAEQLRHPVGVVAAQWSPGSLQHGKHLDRAMHADCRLCFALCTKSIEKHEFGWATSVARSHSS